MQKPSADAAWLRATFRVPRSGEIAISLKLLSSAAASCDVIAGQGFILDRCFSTTLGRCVVPPAEVVA